MPKKPVAPPWLTTLKQHVESKPCVLLRRDESDSGNLTESRSGFNEFTLARPHGLLSDIRTPTACVIFGSPPECMRPGEANPHAYLGIVSSRSPITTLDTRISFDVDGFGGNATMVIATLEDTLVNRVDFIL